VQPPTVTCTISALRGFFTITLDEPDLSRRLILSRYPRKVPALLSVEAVGRLAIIRYCDAFSSRPCSVQTFRELLMGQVVHLPARPPAYPDRSADLEPGECVLLIALRWWVTDHRCDVDPLPRLCQDLETAGAQDAAFSVDRLMAVVARSVCRPIAIHNPRCPLVSGDEKWLLHAASLAQAGNRRRAERALRTALLSAQGAASALGSLEDLGELFTAARLVFRRRSPPASGDVGPQIAEPWFRAGSLDAIH
jgi:hypothetical protein